MVNASLGGFLFEPKGPVEVTTGRTARLEFAGVPLVIPVTVTEVTGHGVHLRLEADEDVYTQLAAHSDEMAALLIAATRPKGE